MAETKTNKSAKPSVKEKIARFFREYKSEIKKITWAKPAQTINNTWVVIVCSVVVAIVIGILDFAVSNGLTFLGNLI